YTIRQFALRRWALDHLEPEELQLVRGLPEQRVFQLPGADPIRMAHGSPRNIKELVIPPGCEAYLRKYLFQTPQDGVTPLAEIFAMAPEPVLMFGHTHLPWSRRLDGRLALNPGAVTFPENGYVGAQYAVLTWDGERWSPEFHAIPYDMAAMRRANEESGFLEASVLARIFLREQLGGKDLTADFFKLARRLAEEAGCGDLPYIRDDIWEQAGQQFDE
ncbi:MAG: metallophosphoesterase, partial [Chloroflexi bacterium]